MVHSHIQECQNSIWPIPPCWVVEALVSELVCCIFCPHSIFQLRNRGELSGPLLSAEVTWTLERSERFSPSQDGGMMEGESLLLVP